MAKKAESYCGREVVLTTNHSKEEALGKPLRAIGIELIVYRDFNTDSLGTFAGEVEREGTQQKVAERKARIGMSAVGCRYGIANEGSFGPHPYLPFGAVGQETVVFVDDENGCIYFEEYETSETNYGHAVVGNSSELLSFARVHSFPNHALVMSPAAAKHALDRKDMLHDLGLQKGIKTEQQLLECFEEFVHRSPIQAVWIETDMRAHLNSTRMRAIRKTMISLARRLVTKCPSCSFPGFGLTGKEAGLRCGNCRRATNVVGWYVHSCQRCQFASKIAKYQPDYTADPQYCEHCNP